jgi:hypothetical protein
MEAPIIIIVITIGYFIYYSIKQNKKPSQNWNKKLDKIQHDNKKRVAQIIKSKNIIKKQFEIQPNEKSEKEKEYYRIQQEKNKLINKLKKVIKANENFKNLKPDDLISIKDFINNNKIKLDDDKILIFLKIDDFIKKIINETKIEINYIIDDFEIRKDTNIINTHFLNLNKTSTFIPGHINVSKMNAEFILPNLINKINFYNENGNKLLQALEEKIITIKYYNCLSFVMLSYLNEDKKLKFFEYYNLFEKLGVFDSTWQNKIFNKLSSIDNNLYKINENLKILNDNIKDISIEINELKENLDSKLSDIKSSTDINNIISGIQLYQLYKINKQTKN